MCDTGCFENGHIKKGTFVLLDSEELDAAARFKISEHLASCNACSERYTDFLTADMQIELPETLNETIIQKAKLIFPRRNNKFTAMQFFKLATAAVLAVTFYTTGIFDYFFNLNNGIQENIPRTSQYLRTANSNLAQKFNTEFTEFTKKINNLNGDELYEKE